MIPKNAGNEEKQLKVLNFAAEKTDDNSKTADTATGIAMIMIRFQILVIKYTPFNLQALLKHCICYYLYNSILCFFRQAHLVLFYCIVLN